jgi:hypothetical protein
MSGLARVPVTIVAAAIALAALIAAVALELHGDDATPAWTACTVALGVAIGGPIDPHALIGAPRPRRATDRVAPPPPAPPRAVEELER